MFKMLIADPENIANIRGKRFHAAVTCFSRANFSVAGRASYLEQPGSYFTAFNSTETKISFHLLATGPYM